MRFRVIVLVFVFNVLLTLVSCQKPEKKVDRLRSELKASDTQEQMVGIINKIAQIEHSRASSTLLNTLDDINYRDVHSQVILALGEVRPIHKQTVAKLLGKLSNLALRDNVIKSLSLIGSEATSAVIEQLKSEDEEARNSASYVLSQMGESAATGILNLLQDRNPNIRHSAITLIGDIAANSNSVETYIPKLVEVFGLETLDLDQANVEFQLLAEAFAKIGESAIPHLTEALKDTKLQVRIGVALALYPIDNSKKDIVLPILIEALGDDVAGPVVAMQLANFGESILPNLEKAFNDDNFNTYQNAAVALGKIGISSLPILQSFIESISSGTVAEFDQITLDKAEVTLEALQMFGEGASPLTAELIKILRHKQLGESVAITLAHIGESTVPNLIQSLKSKNIRTRKKAALALGTMGPVAIAAIESLSGMLRDSEIYADVAYALTRIQFSQGLVAGGLTIGFGPENVFGYTLTYIESASARSELLRLGSDDGIKVWLNDKMVWRNNYFGSAQPNRDVVKINLKKGKNKLLIKVNNVIGPWVLYANLSGKKLEPWQVIHPFPGSLDTAHPIESKIDLEKRYIGLENKEVGWYQIHQIGPSTFMGTAGAKSKKASPKEVPLKTIIAVLKKGFLQQDFTIRSTCIEAINTLGDMATPLILDLAKETAGTVSENTVAQLLTANASIDTFLKLIKDRKSSWAIRSASYEGLKVYTTGQAGLTESQVSPAKMSDMESGIAYFEGVESARTLVKSLEGEMTQMQLQKITDESIRVGPEAVPFLITAFNNNVPQARGRASSILVEIGQDAVPALKTALRIGSDKEIYWAELTLKKIMK